VTATDAEADAGPGPRSRRPATRSRLPRVHRAWVVAGVTFLALVAAAAFRSSTGVLLEPMEGEFGWTRGQTSAAVSVNLLLYGLVAPFAAALMERFGIRRVVAFALLLTAAGSGLTLLMTQAWQLVALWGVLVGIGAGAMALVFGAVVANRWFVSRRGLVTGVFSAASATGQLVFLPLIANLAQRHGWRSAVALTAGLALLMVPLVLALLRDRPADVGRQPYGAGPAYRAPEVVPVTGGFVRAAGTALGQLREASRSFTFWVLAGTFFVCGWSTNGLIQTHFVPAAHDHGMPPTTAASLLALIGIFDIAGTIGSGWLSDRVDSRLLLLVYYGLRGLSLLAVPALLGPDLHPTLLLFVVFYGLDWVATVPPTVQLCRQAFGLERAGVVFGWVFASHMIGAGLAAAFAGLVRESTGSYTPAWFTAGALCLVAAVAVLTIPAPAREPAPVG
jgi:predicted MFS family arabinose efflux permease